MARTDIARGGAASQPEHCQRVLKPESRRWFICAVWLVCLLMMLAVPAVGIGADPAPSQADVDRGEALFEGSDRFANGAASCASCHQVGEVGRMGGGQLGPPLDHVGVAWGAKTISGWLLSPPAPTMAPIFGKGSGGELTQRERDLLGAYIAASASQKVADRTVQKKGVSVADRSMNRALLIGGAVAAIGVLLLFALIYRGRLRSVRGRMVKDARLPK